LKTGTNKTSLRGSHRRAELYQAACHSDLEGIVAKYKWGAYCPDPGSSSWIKIKNPAYSQAVGRHEPVHPTAGSLRER
jgi:ATP-dependent DNA ligase